MGVLQVAKVKGRRREGRAQLVGRSSLDGGRCILIDCVKQMPCRSVRVWRDRGRVDRRQAGLMSLSMICFHLPLAALSLLMTHTRAPGHYVLPYLTKVWIWDTSARTNAARERESQLDR